MGVTIVQTNWCELEPPFRKTENEGDVFEIEKHKETRLRSVARIFFVSQYRIKIETSWQTSKTEPFSIDQYQEWLVTKNQRGFSTRWRESKKRGVSASDNLSLVKREDRSLVFWSRLFWESMRLRSERIFQNLFVLFASLLQKERMSQKERKGRKRPLG